ncbi:hypothetical protein MTO96_013479 [Rhipicephalus appendiculatus]
MVSGGPSAHRPNESDHVGHTGNIPLGAAAMRERERKKKEQSEFPCAHFSSLRGAYEVSGIPSVRRWRAAKVPLSSRALMSVRVSLLLLDTRRRR